MNSAKSGTHATRPRPLVARPRPLWCRTARAHRKGDLQRDLQKRLQLMEKLIHKFIFRGVFHHIPFFIGLIVFFSFASPSPGHAKTVWCTNCSEKFTQALDRVTNVEQLRNIVADYQESVQQTIQQVRMVQQNVEQYANMVQNTIGLPAEIYGKVHGTFTRLADLTSQLRTSRGDLSAMAGIFRNIYAESDKMASLMTLPMDDLQKTVDTWGENVDRSAEALFQLSGDQLQSMVRDTPALEAHIDELLSTPEGQMQALMAANTLTSMQLQEARQLRELTATMSQAQLSSQMKGEKEDQLQKEQWRKATETGLLEELSNMELPKTF